VGKKGSTREKLGRERTGNPKKGHLSKGPSKDHFAETNLQYILRRDLMDSFGV
jgi:hypothetical protein